MVKRTWQAWKQIIHAVGNFQARALLTIFYAVLVFPFGITACLFSDPLRIKHRPAKWLDHPSETFDLPWAKRQ